MTIFGAIFAYRTPIGKIYSEALDASNWLKQKYFDSTYPLRGLARVCAKRPRNLDLEKKIGAGAPLRKKKCKKMAIFGAISDYRTPYGKNYSEPFDAPNWLKQE